MTQKQLKEMVLKILNEESRENLMNVNQHKSLSKLLKQVEIIINGYTRGETKKTGKGKFECIV